MNTLLKRKFLNFGIFTLGTFLLECISFSFMGWGFLPVYFFLDLLIIAILGSLVFLFKNTLFDKIYLPIVMFISTCLFCLNANYYVATGAIFAIQDFRLLFKADKVIGMAIQFLNAPILTTEFVLFGVFAFAIIFINIKFKVKANQKIKKDKGILFGAILSILTAGFIYPTTLYTSCGYERTVNNNQLIDYVNLSKNYNYQKLGMFSYYIKDIQTTYFPSNQITVAKLKDYCTRTKTETNDFTGLLKGYNVITIMIETGARVMLNETLTPNLWKLTQEGVDCTHCYTKNKTNISEYIGITGNYTSNGIDPANFNCEVPFSVPNTLKDYHSVYFHDVGATNDIYSRHTFIPKLGFKETCLHEYLYPGEKEWQWHWFTYDSVTTQKVIDKIKTLSDNFYAFYTTLTMHMPYIESKEAGDYFIKLREWYLPKLKQAEQEGKWTNPLKDTDSAINYQGYMLKVMDFDRGLGYLIDYLNESGKMDNTLLVLYGDHDLYDYGASGIPMSQMIYGKDNLYEIALYNTMLTFYNPTLNEKYYSLYKKHTFDDFVSSYSVVPSTLDLLGAKYNDNLCLEQSIFNFKKDNPHILYSFEISSYMNENYLSKNANTIEKTFDDNKTNQKFLDACREKVTKILYFNYIYMNNIFKNNNYNDFLEA